MFASTELLLPVWETNRQVIELMVGPGSKASWSENVSGNSWKCTTSERLLCFNYAFKQTRKQRMQIKRKLCYCRETARRASSIKIL